MADYVEFLKPLVSKEGTPCIPPMVEPHRGPEPGLIGGQGNGLEFRNVTNSTHIRDKGYNLAWDGGSTYMIPVGSFYLTPGSSNTYVFRFTGAPSSTSITSTLLNLVIRKVA
jgi:hypothetical protein